MPAIRPVVRVAPVRVRSRTTDPTVAKERIVRGVATDCDDMVYLLSLWVFRTHRYGLSITVPFGTVAVKRKTEKHAPIAEVFVLEELGGYMVEKAGSRRSSVERREEILRVALSVLAER